ncbi:MAG TPA: hypothetical protein VIG29_10865 [Vicinamibacteria bacterium]
MTSTFLVDGEFPATTEGRPWGKEGATLEVAGIPIGIEGLSRLQRDTLAKLHPVIGEQARARVSLFRAEREAFRRIDPRGWSYALDFDYGSDRTHLVGMDWMARLEWRPEMSAGLWVVAESPGAFEGAFENFLRVLAAHILLLEGGALLHSASVVTSEGAHLFVGPSGAGKSTISRAARSSGRAVVSDDLNVVTPGLALGGSSFFSEIGSRREGTIPLRGIYRLEKGTEDAIRPIGRAEALASLIACTPFVNRSRFLAHRLWANLGALVQRVPSHVLTFRREAHFWSLLPS